MLMLRLRSALFFVFDEHFYGGRLIDHLMNKYTTFTAELVATHVFRIMGHN